MDAEAVLKDLAEQKQRAENAERAVLAERLKWENEVTRLNTQVKALRESLKDREATIEEQKAELAKSYYRWVATKTQ